MSDLIMMHVVILIFLEEFFIKQIFARISVITICETNHILFNIIEIRSFFVNFLSALNIRGAIRGGLKGGSEKIVVRLQTTEMKIKWISDSICHTFRFYI